MLNPFLSSKEYAKIGIELVRQKKGGLDITPGFDNIFRAYLECPWHKVHTVILGQDVYFTKNKDKTYVADGIAFSARECSEPPSILNSIFEAIDTSVYNGDYTTTAVYNHNRKEATWDLNRWARNGILLINCSYTTVVGTPGSHMALWKPFTEFVLKLLNDRKDSLGIVLMGPEAQSYETVFTNLSHHTFECEHPATALYKQRKWNHRDVFADLTKFQKKTNNITIDW